MQNAIAAELRHRLELYRRIFDFCRAGRFSLARFVSFAPDKLRLSIGESAFRIRVPVSVENELVEDLVRGLENPRSMRTKVDQELSRRALRLAQIDADIDPFRTRAMLASSGSHFLARAARVHQKSFAEVGHGAGGEDTAFVANLAFTEAMRRAVEPNIARQLIALSMIDLSMQAYLTLDGEAEPSLRLGLKCAAMLSPLALGATTESFIKRPVSWYRTTPDAVRFARRVILDPIETIDLGRVVAAISERLLVDDGAQATILRDTLLEMARDVMLAVALFDAAPPTILLETVSSQQALMLAVLNARRRNELSASLDRATRTRPLEALLALLKNADRVTAGDPAPLGLHGDPKERTKLAAIGAVVLALDEKSEELRSELLHRIEFVDGTSSIPAYRISDDEAPLFRLPSGPRQALFYIDARNLASWVANIGGASAAETLARIFHRALLAEAKTLRGIEVLNVSAESMLFKGDVVAMLELAIALRALIERARALGDESIPELLGGSSSARLEAEAELQQLQERRSRIDDAIARAFDEGGTLTYLRDARGLIEERIEGVEEMNRRRAAKKEARPLELGAMLVVEQAGSGAEVDAGGGRTIYFSPVFEQLIRRSAKDRIAVSTEALELWKSARAGLLTFDDRDHEGERRLTAFARDDRQERARFRFVAAEACWELM